MSCPVALRTPVEVDGLVVVGDVVGEVAGVVPPEGPLVGGVVGAAEVPPFAGVVPPVVGAVLLSPVPVDTLRSLQSHRWTVYDGQYLILAMLGLFSHSLVPGGQ